MNIHEFKAKWRGSSLGERAGYQQHFLDLCDALGVPKPAEVDREGTSYTFERGVTKTTGGKGFADVWYRGHFAWEYKGPGRSLDAAYQQLLQYLADLENPPLLVVCDFERFIVRTNFTNTVQRTFEFDLETIDQPENLRVLRALWGDPRELMPTQTVQEVTEQAAEQFGALALGLAERGIAPERAAHFLVQILFCLFAEDVGLLPKGHFSRLLEYAAEYPEDFEEQIRELFVAMRDGGRSGFERIERFNGGLFERIDPVPLTRAELRELVAASRLDWTSIEPAIIGTLFERSLDPARRSQLGAHYTGRADIERVVEPVVMTPLRRRWAEVKAKADAMKARWDAATTPQTRRNRQADFARILQGFQDELAAVTVLDPACGSGNFLYVALAKLLDLEKEVVTYGMANGLPGMFPLVRPTQLYGLEINQYAQELTQVVIWIGYLQWMTQNGFQPRRDPILGDMDNIRLQDALLDRSDPDNPKEAEWPPADYIIGNPPFLGGNKVRQELGDTYVDSLFNVYDRRVARFADLCCYFFEKAREQIENGRVRRAGLLATNSIRGGANRQVLERISQSGGIFMAWDDEEWILDGAAVRISIVGFDDGSESERFLDGKPVELINPDLTASVDITVARRLPENFDIAYMGMSKKGPFDVPGNLARHWLGLPRNPNGRPNSDVVKPIINGIDVTRRPRDMWIIDFGIDMGVDAASLYEAPFEYVVEHVKPVREKNNRAAYRDRWWLLAESRPALRKALVGKHRYIATPTVAKHRLFIWVDVSVIPDQQIIVFARDDDYFFGVLHSRAHEVWSLRMGTSLEDRPRYTPTTTFETFPFPRPTDEQREAIAAAAARLNELRENWLNPEGASEAELKKRTLTNLYNQRPTWLAQAHDALDRAVWAAYGWPEDPADTDDETILRRLLELNLERANQQQQAPEANR